jgi:hypothetical protein
MTPDDRVAHWEKRQEALIRGMNGLVETQNVIVAMIAELAAWLKQPASSDLPDLIRAMITTNEALTASNRAAAEQLAKLGAAIARLPADVARAVRDGEVR